MRAKVRVLRKLLSRFVILIGTHRNISVAVILTSLAQANFRCLSHKRNHSAHSQPQPNVGNNYC